MITKAERKEVWIDQIKTAIFAANNAVIYNPEDNGTCRNIGLVFRKKIWKCVRKNWLIFI